MSGATRSRDRTLSPERDHHLGINSDPSRLPARSGTWQAEPGFGVYVHIPFCMHRCHYCDFNTYEGLDALHEPYVDALCRHVESLDAPDAAVTSVFFGGGTPTLLTVPVLRRILVAVRDRVAVSHDAEVTIEANPESVDEAYLAGLLEIGFNRVSIGVQSLRPGVLGGLGREHGPERALGAIAAARRAGFRDVNADLIYGSPWESEDDWRASLEGVVEAGTDHISAYALTVEEATPLATLVRTGRVPDVDPDIQADRFEVAEDLLAEAGFHRYEVSNWAKPGRASAHNVLYWSAGDYLGIGAGAHGHRQGHRYWSTRLPRDFIDRIAAGTSPIEGGEHLAPDERVSEALMLGLRLASGIDMVSFSARYGDGLAARSTQIDMLVRAGSLQREGPRLRVAPDEVFRTDAVVGEIF